MSKAYHSIDEVSKDFESGNIIEVINHFKEIKESGGDYYYQNVYMMSLNTLITHIKWITPQDILIDNIKRYPELLEYFI